METIVQSRIDHVIDLETSCVVIGWKNTWNTETKIVITAETSEGTELNGKEIELNSDDESFFLYSRPDVEAHLGIPEYGDNYYGFIKYLKIQKSKITSLKIIQHGKITSTVSSSAFENHIHYLSQANEILRNHIAKIASQNDIIKVLASLKQLEIKRAMSPTPNRSYHFDNVIFFENQGYFCSGWIEAENIITGAAIANTIGQNNIRIFTSNRPDVKASLRKQQKQCIDECGFFFFAKTSTNKNNFLKISFENGTHQYLTLPDKDPVNNLDQLKDAIQKISNISNFYLYELFESGMGAALDQLASKIISKPNKVECLIFGPQNQSPKASVIIPIYGRYDFIRHQLAHFSADKDFDTLEVIYVIDDPKIKQECILTAISLNRNLPIGFKLVLYDKNLGFAGANNIGVKYASSDLLLLLNSDIIPQQSDWVSTLIDFYKKTPTAGIVAPILEFYDGTVQHAGMENFESPYIPQFSLNQHPGKGWLFSKESEPRKCELLTGACLLISKADYLSTGGFDEGYLIGDFEDSDLCKKITAANKELWLVPNVKLWHLERQSQNIGTEATGRHFITMFNAWRYKKQISLSSI